MKKYTIALIAILVSINIYSQMGINTSAPTSTLDINGDFRVRNLPESTTTQDISLVVDVNGNVKRRMGDSKGIMRAYLSSDFSSGTNDSIYRILNWNVVNDPNGDFDPNTGSFTAPEAGLYKISITSNAWPTNLALATIPYYVYGLVDGETNQWLMRFAIPATYYPSTSSSSSASVGRAHTFIGVAQLQQGKSYYLGVTRNLTLLSNVTSDTGIGSFFEIQLIRN